MNRKEPIYSVRYIFLVIVVIISLFPLIWLAYNSLKGNNEFFLDPWSLPKAFHFDNYREAWQRAQFGLYFKNSLIVTVSATLLSLLLASMVSFCISRFPFKMNQYVYTFFVLGLLIPGNALLIPVYKMVVRLGLLDTYWAMILVYVTFNLSVTIFILVASMKSIPREVEEAAVIDGCGVIRIFTKVVLPLSVPGLATTAILNIIANWNEMIMALLFSSSEQTKTIPVGLSLFTGAYQSNYTMMFAAIVIAIAPVLIVFIVLQEKVISGITAGAVKG